MAPQHSEKSIGEEPKEESPQQETKTDSSISSEAKGATPATGTSSSKSPEGEDRDDNKDEGDKQEDTSELTTAADPSQWQAVWAPQYSAYYFYNAVTQETTWTNPLQPDASTSQQEPSTSAVSTSETAADANAEASSSTGPTQTAAQARYAALQEAALSQGIDPMLAHLDPTLLTPAGPGSSGVPGDLPTFTARFNARTGKFAADSSRTPGHLSEYERAKRMSEFYFDVNKWEEDLARRGGSNIAEEGEEDGSGKKRKRPSKKDLERFKEQKKQKKIAKTAWLRT